MTGRGTARTGAERRLLTIWIGSLCLIAGMVNISTLHFFGMTVSHHTGNLSRLAMAAERRDLGELLLFGGLLLAFVLGSFISGALLYGHRFLLKRRYGLILIGLGALTAAVIALARESDGIVLWFALVMGFQNGMLVHYNGALVRTTHYSGYLTDIGVTLGRRLRGERGQLWKVRLYLLSLICFMLGGGMSAALERRPLRFGRYAIPAAYVLSGLLYFYLRRRAERRQTP